MRILSHIWNSVLVVTAVNLVAWILQVLADLILQSITWYSLSCSDIYIWNRALISGFKNYTFSFIFCAFFCMFLFITISIYYISFLSNVCATSEVCGCTCICRYCSEKGHFCYPNSSPNDFITSVSHEQALMAVL